MNGKLDKFTAARIRRFNATGLAVQKALPFERLRFEAKTQMISAGQRPAARELPRQQRAS